MPDITVVIPTLNRWQLLSTGALRSALTQEDVDLEVIIVDDGSTDETPSGLELLQDERLRVIRHTRSQGLARARNAGIAAARGEWVAFLDDDDFWAPWKLRRQLDLAASAQACFIYSPALYVSEDGQSVQLIHAVDPDELTPRLLAGEGIPAGGSNVLVRTEAVRQVDGFDEKITHLGDFDCWIRLDRICRPARCDEPLVAYVQHRTGMHLRDARLVPADIRRMQRKYEAEYEALGGRVDGEGWVLWIADEHRIAGRRLKAAGVYLVSAWHYRRLRHLVRGVSVVPGGLVRAVARRLVRRVRGLRRDPATTSVSAELARLDPVDALPAWLAPYLSQNG
jgi:glycosyltransferase involved in cell wall biosynthesis